MQKTVQKIKVLFLCTGNSCRSQMAEGWAKALKGGEIDAYSAGIKAHGLNPNAVKVMKEVGIDISSHTSKEVESLKNIKFDAVITLCGNAHETCPVFPGDCKVVHVGFEDPPKMAEQIRKRGGSQEEELDCYRKVRDEIKSFVETLPQSLEEL
ncbi:MAG: arsenate reductase ArsC [Candidatus Dadabacteria bacterium]|nr:MAG: arsenate reductase ArsC [Candidatus Dadabacteria bacterium]